MTENQIPESTLSSNLKIQIWLRMLTAPLALGLLLFIPAGRLDYWQAWVYIALNMAIVLLTLYVLRDSPDLVAERLKPGQGMQSWDKVYFAFTTPLYFIMLIIAGLDAGRFGWSGPLPVWIYLLSVTVYCLGQGIMLWAKTANRYFSSVVRIQADRRQSVCRGGPYAYVRHPGYLGGILFGLVGPLMLGSWWALIPAALAALGLVIRTYFEDRLLQAELPGYKEYAQDVKHRLIPAIW